MYGTFTVPVAVYSFFGGQLQLLLNLFRITLFFSKKNKKILLDLVWGL
jgi:hypothetical protein